MFEKYFYIHYHNDYIVKLSLSMNTMNRQSNNLFKWDGVSKRTFPLWDGL